jgi:hypothetical protein
VLAGLAAAVVAAAAEALSMVPHLYKEIAVGLLSCGAVVVAGAQTAIFSWVYMGQATSSSAKLVGWFHLDSHGHDVDPNPFTIH